MDGVVVDVIREGRFCCMLWYGVDYILFWVGWYWGLEGKKGVVSRLVVCKLRSIMKVKDCILVKVFIWDDVNVIKCGYKWWGWRSEMVDSSWNRVILYLNFVFFKRDVCFFRFNMMIFYCDDGSYGCDLLIYLVFLIFMFWSYSCCKVWVSVILYVRGFGF